MRYLIFRNDGIGDFITTTPLIDKIIRNDEKSKICIIVSSRNSKYVKLFKEIDQIIQLKENPSIFEVYKAFKEIRSFKPDFSIVLKAKYYNYILSKFSGSRLKLGLKIISDTKTAKKKSKPHPTFIDFLMQKYETIDYSDNYRNSMNIHHAMHFTRLITQIFSHENINSIEKLNYLKPGISNLSRNFISNLKKFNLHNAYAVLHIDEKWDNLDWDIIEFINFYNDLKKAINKNIIVTEGFIKSKFNIELFKNSTIIDSFTFSDSLFQIDDSRFKTILVNNPSIELLTSIVSNANFVIESHGALTHISSSYNVPVVDLCKSELVDYFKKWKPISTKNIQISLDNSTAVTKKIIEFLSKNDLNRN